MTTLLTTVEASAPVRVGLVGFGRPPTVDLRRLSRRLNRLQDAFTFAVEADLPREAVGEPDFEGRAYTCEKLWPHLRARRQVDLLIGVTADRIASGVEPGGSLDAPTETDYFSLSTFDGLAIVTTHADVNMNRGERKTVEQYVGYLAIGETLMMVVGRNLCHYRSEDCLFDECQDRGTLASCMATGVICNRCLIALYNSTANVRQIEAAQRILKWAKRNQWSVVAKRVVAHPVTSFSAGVGVGWVVSILGSSTPVALVLAATLLPIMGVVVYERLRR